MPNVFAKFMFSKLVRSTYFASVIDRLPLLCGMDCYFLDALGNVAQTAPRRPSSPFVRLLQKEDQTRRMLEINRQALLAGDHSAMSECGYHELVHRIAVEEETIGYIMLSACRGGDEDRRASRATWTQLVRRGAMISWSLWLEHWSALPEQTPEQRAAWRQTMALYAVDAMRRLEADLHPEQSALPNLVRRACSHIHDHHTEILRLKDVAHTLGVSAEHLSRLFHQSTGLRFREYLAETRVGVACQALEQSDLPIAEIAHNSGFSTLSRFNSCFKQHRGMTPRDWRKRERRNMLVAQEG
jgi:AraC-like DNA-binding protein